MDRVLSFLVGLFYEYIFCLCFVLLVGTFYHVPKPPAAAIILVAFFTGIRYVMITTIRREFGESTDQDTA